MDTLVNNPPEPLPDVPNSQQTRMIPMILEIENVNLVLYRGVVRLAKTDWQPYISSEMLAAAANAAAAHQEWIGALQAYSQLLGEIPSQQQAAAISIQATLESIVRVSGEPLMKAHEDCSRLYRNLQDAEKATYAGVTSTENATDAFEKAYMQCNVHLNTDFISLTDDLKSCSEKQVGDYAVLIMRYMCDRIAQADSQHRIDAAQISAFSRLLKDVADSHPNLLRNVSFDKIYQRALAEIRTLPKG